MSERSYCEAPEEKETGLYQTSSPLGSRRVEERLLSDEYTMKQFVSRHMHTRRPLGKLSNKKYIVAEPYDLVCHVVLWRCWSVLHST